MKNYLISALFISAMGAVTGQASINTQCLQQVIINDDYFLACPVVITVSFLSIMTDCFH